MRFITPLLRILAVIILLYNFINDILDYLSESTNSMPLEGILFVGFFSLSYILYCLAQGYREITNDTPLAANFLRIYAILFELFNVAVSAFIVYSLVKGSTGLDTFSFDLFKAIVFVVGFSYLFYVDIKLLTKKRVTASI